VDDFVLRFVIEGTDDEYFCDVDGTRIRFTVCSLLQEFAEGRLRDFATGAATLSEWRGRYLGLDRSAIVTREPRALLKYEIALAALAGGLPRNATMLQDFARGFAADFELEPPSGRSVIRWMNNLEGQDRRIGAMKNRSGRERGSSPLSPIVDRIVHQCAAIYYADESIKKMDSHALVVHEWNRLREQGVPGIGRNPPSKTTVVNRINACENETTYGSKFGRHEADRYFQGAGISVPVTRPFQLVQMDGTEYEQICHFSTGAMIPSAKLKSVWLIDAASLFVFPSGPFAGPYRSEMGMAALLGALTPPALDDETMQANPMLGMIFGKVGRIRVDNDRALIPPAAIGNLANVVTRVELAKRYGPDEKASIENFHGFLLRRLDGLPGTVLSARSRRKSIRRDPLAEASMTRADFSRRVEQLRLEWNDIGHDALGGRTPNDIMIEHITSNKVRFTPPGEVRRHIARTVVGVLTTDGVVFDNIRYKWNRTGVTTLLSDNIANQHFSKRLEGTARCEVSLRVYDWNLDYVDIFNDSTHEFVTLWSEDEDYTGFLTRYEHKFHRTAVISGATGAQTHNQKALRRADGLRHALSDLHTAPYGIAKKAAAILECAEFTAKARNIRNDPDLTNFEHLLIDTEVGGSGRVDIPKGPSQSRDANSTNKKQKFAGQQNPSPDWAGLDPAPRSNLQMLELDQEEDLDGGIDWDDCDNG
jgi:putative transposase